jgi:hypothetical protein
MSAVLNQPARSTQTRIRRPILRPRTNFVQPGRFETVLNEIPAVLYMALIAATIMYLYVR